MASVRINGEFSRVAREDVAKQVYDAMGNSFVQLDLEHIQSQLEQMPWVDGAKLSRAWPDGLNVTIIEHKPIARWGKHDALNHRGEVIALLDDESSRALLEGLPMLEGAAGMERQVMDQYRALTKVLADHGLSIRRLRCDLGRSWSMELGESVQVNIGRDQVMDRVSRFLIVFETQLQQRWAELSAVDLRYFNGVAVKWRESQVSSEAATKS
ncbi:MAG: cell division protein FtsQ/DivIB [Cellvibrionaceae bacterium]